MYVGRFVSSVLSPSCCKPPRNYIMYLLDGTTRRPSRAVSVKAGVKQAAPALHENISPANGFVEVLVHLRFSLKYPLCLSDGSPPQALSPPE